MDAADVPTFARMLRDLRIAAGLSQEGLAERSGLSVRGLSDLERGVRRAPRLETVRMLMDGLALGDDQRAALLQAARPHRARGPDTGDDGFGRLPQPLAPLIGRSDELGKVQRLLLRPDVRIVTLVGPGGVGKTTLAVAVTHELADKYADGAAFVPLGPLIDPRLVPPAVGEALGLRESAGRSMTEAILHFLRSRHQLLFFDNFEHLIAAAPLVADIVASCPRVDAVVTSRERLHLRGEHLVVVQPLETPDPAASASTAALANVPAVQLFLRRAQAVDPGFSLSNGNGEAVAAICARLDGLPLAIELAASWVHVLSAEELLARLETPLPYLTRGPRDADERHQTLSNTIGWSYQLLTPDEQRMFRRMAVFIGGVDLEAAEAIAGFDRGPADTPPIEIIASLVDKSLLQRAGISPMRFTMLETIREFALDKLADVEERDDMLARHAAWYVDLGVRMREHLLREVESAWLDRLELDHGNLRNALVWTLFRRQDPDSAQLALRLASSLWLFWYYHCHLAEGRWWLEHAVAAVGEARTADRAMALVGLGTLAHAQGDEEGSLAWLTQGLALAREISEPTVTAFALSVRGNWAEDSGNYPDAERYFAEANRLFMELDDQVNVAITGYHLGVVAFGQGRADEAGARCRDALALSQRMGDAWGTAVSLAQLGLVHWRNGALSTAADALDEALTLFTRIGSIERIADTLCRVAVLGEASGDHRAAVRLFTDAAELRGRVGAVQDLPEREVYDTAEQRARAMVDAPPAPSGDGKTDRSLDRIVQEAHRVLMDIVGLDTRP